MVCIAVYCTYISMVALCILYLFTILNYLCHLQYQLGTLVHDLTVSEIPGAYPSTDVLALFSES